MSLLQPNQVFAGRYRIERFLAQGGMGAVYVAEQTATELLVAIKVLWPQVLASKDAVEKFQTEAKVAARVNSEHIVKVLDAGYDPATAMPFLVMELLTGTSFDDLVQNRGPLPLAQAATLMMQAASGLDKAHRYTGRDGLARPIVHRDLKPENLFLTSREDGQPLVKILDFGIAKVLGEGTARSREVKGTPLYMAFEQATGERITPQTDIWAFGLIVFYLLTGRCYWTTAASEESTLAALVGEILTKPIVAPSERIRELGGQPAWPPEFDSWFLRCVDRNPARRYPSAGDAAAALANALLGPSAAEAMALAGLGSTPSVGQPQLLIRDARGSIPSVLPGAPARTADAIVLPGSSTGSASSRGKVVVFAAIGAVFLMMAGGLVAAIASRPSAVSSSASVALPEPVTSAALQATSSASTAASATSEAAEVDRPPPGLASGATVVSATEIPSPPPRSTKGPTTSTPPATGNPPRQGSDLYGER